MGKIRVLAACANVLFRRGLVQTLQETSNIEVIQETADGVQAVRLASHLHPDVVLVGSVVERLTSIELIQQIKAANRSVLVLACSGQIDVEHILSLLQAGADGYILENTKPEALIAAISTACVGESILDPLVLDALVRQILGPSKEPLSPESSPLSKKETQVLKLGAQGMKNQEIAANLHMSLSTVKAHWSNIFAKMSVGSRVQAVFHAIKEGWVLIRDIN